MKPNSTKTRNSFINRSGALSVEGIQDGAEDARRAVDAIAPAVSAGVSKAVYGAAFGVSFGVCLTGLVIARLVPRTSSLALGAYDGFQAARTTAEAVVPSKTPHLHSQHAGGKKRKKQHDLKGAVKRARGEVTATALRITEDTSLAHMSH